MIFNSKVKTAYVVALITLVVGGVGFRAAAHYLGFYLQKEAVPLRRDLSMLPTTIGDWKRVGADQIEKEDAVAELGTDRYLTRTYARNGDPKNGMIQVHVAYYTGMIDTVPHIPERCMYAAGLIPLEEAFEIPLDVSFTPDPLGGSATNRATGERYAYQMVEDPVTRQMLRVPMPIGEMKMRLTRFQDPKRPKTEVDAGYFFIANGRVTPNTWGVRKLAFNLTDKQAYYCKVQLAINYPIGEKSPVELFQADASDFLKNFTKYLMRALPDWPALEAQEMAELAKK
jgi:hypothetical protein